MDDHPESLAANNRAARDMACNLKAILDCFDALRRADFDEPTDPPPTWWDGFVQDPEWVTRVDSANAQPNRLHRIAYTRRKAEEVIAFTLERWDSLCSPIPRAPEDDPIFYACKESLRNLSGILSRQQEGPRLRCGVIPDERHLRDAVPEVWNEEQESDGERQAQARIDELAYTSAMRNGSKVKTQAALKTAKRDHARKVNARVRRNQAAREKAYVEGRVTSAERASIHHAREVHMELIQRWRLGEKDVRVLLQHLNGVLIPLQRAFDRFYKTLDATTVPVGDGGRTVGGIAHAVALSEATNALYRELGATTVRLFQHHGQSMAEFPPGVALMESDSPDGPWTPIPAGEIRMATMGIGGDGADAMLLAALEGATNVAAFPIDKWNAMQEARPGANHQRFHAGDVVSVADLAVLESAAKLLRMNTPSAPPTVSVPPELVAHWKAAAAAIPSVLEENRRDDDDEKLTYPTVQDLVAVVDPTISDDTFQRVRNAAGIKVTEKGWKARNRRYPPNEVDLLIAAAEAGPFLQRLAMVRAWTKWSSKSAASQPHAGKSAAR